jgi:hypothetical protein
VSLLTTLNPTPPGGGPTPSSASAIAKLTPDRTIHLRGFDRRGASAAICEAHSAGFKAYGVFRDMADFAVIVLHDADNFFEHYSMEYLPDFDFTGMVLSFDLNYDGIQPIDSPKYNWIDWATLDCVRADGSTAQVKLWDYATLASGTFAVASGVITVQTPGAVAFDRLTLWLNNIAFDFIAAGGETASAVANNLRDQINQANWPSLGPTLAVMASTSGAAITLQAGRYGTVNTSATAVTWVSGEKFTGIAGGSPIYIAGTLYTVSTVNSATSLTLTASAGTLTGARYLAERGGYDGNMLTVYAIWKNANLTADVSSRKLSGGNSDVTWNVSIDFTARGIDSLRQCWLTLAPKLADSAAYSDTEWTATFSNWSVADPSIKRPLKVASPGSTWVGNRDAWAAYSGSGWAEEAGFYWQGYARRSKTTNDKITIKYSCQYTHDLYVGTSLYTDRGIAGIKLDGDTETDLDCYLSAEPAVVTRRKVRSGVAAGEHAVEIRIKGTKHASSTDYYVYFDHLCAARLGDVPAPVTTYSNVSPAIDYDTDHTYKLTPARLVWNLDRLGFYGTVNEYVGVFWWNQRKRVGGTFKTWTVAFGGTWADGDAAFVTIGGFTMGKSVFPADTVSTIAAHFKYFINQTLVGMWAETTGTAGELKIHVRTPIWSDTKSTSKTSAAGTISESGDLSAGTEGTWEIDTAASNPINWPTRKWHADLFAEINAKGWGAVVALSMELVNPPDSSGSPMIARFNDGSKVLTATGFGSLSSAHCAFIPRVADYQKAAYKELAGLMNTAGLTPWLQFGEFVWWFFAGGSPASMAFYDADTVAAANTALGRPLATFSAPTSDPSVNSYVDANWLRSRIKTHIDSIRTHVLATYSGAKFELLWPYDVNYPTPTPLYSLGGQLNRYVNLPSEYETKSGSGLDRLKMEALAFGASERDGGKAVEAIRFPTVSPLAWPKADTAYLVPIFNGGCPWEREYLAATAHGSPLINFWAFDHVCLLSWPLPLPRNRGDAQLI